MTSIVDALGHTHTFENSPQRIVSLVPSTTETLYQLDVWDRVVGVTRYCVHPRSATSEKIVVGGTKQCNYDTIRSLNPDLILCNQEENTVEMVNQFKKLGVPVVVFFPKTQADAMEDLHTLGNIVGRSDIVDEWKARWQAIQGNSSTTPFQYAYLIWRKPWMVVGTDTFIHQQLNSIGGDNYFGTSAERYQNIDKDALLNCTAHILLSSEPFPFSQVHRQELIDMGIPKERIHFINGEYCSWHGVRMLESLSYLQEWKKQHIAT